MSNGVKSQGTQLFFVDILDSNLAVQKLTCPTGISGLGGPADQIEDTCLDNTTDRTYQRGLGNPGQVSAPFNFIPTAMDQRDLFALKDNGEDISWLLAFSDGPVDASGAQTSLATTTDSDENIDPMTDRTSMSFRGYIADVTIDAATNDLVRGTLLIQRTGKVTPNWKA